MLTQGDLCSHCRLIIMLPIDLEPKCMGCGELINRDE
jgi:hypothetical protein